MDEDDLLPRDWLDAMARFTEKPDPLTEYFLAECQAKAELKAQRLRAEAAKRAGLSNLNLYPSIPWPKFIPSGSIVWDATDDLEFERCYQFWLQNGGPAC